MIIMILEKVTVGLRGELTRWLIEPRTGVFVGQVSARVRDKLWEKAVTRKRGGGVMQIWNTNTEQGYFLRSSGDTSRNLVEVEGLQLIQIPGEFEKTKRLSIIHNKE
ncbi:MAG: type I-E CRISPR-associated endoribonuclease Cas2 [Anaerolineaceae bacterium]|jgi:CRISPR-associated protein Cas2|nr:type I-E CRISPR-associated endoribonuclease Cas2 [Anaerolineaceae bacterium]